MVKKLFVIGLAFASLGLAQRGGGGGGKNGGGGGNAPMAMPVAQTKFDKIAAALDLNKDQKKTVKTILEDGAKAAAPLREQISKTRIVVGDAIIAKKSDEELKQVAKTSSDISTQLTRLELDTFAKLVASLDETQKKDMASLGRVLALMNDIYHTKNWNED